MLKRRGFILGFTFAALMAASVSIATISGGHTAGGGGSDKMTVIVESNSYRTFDFGSGYIPESIWLNTFDPLNPGLGCSENFDFCSLQQWLKGIQQWQRGLAFGIDDESNLNRIVNACNEQNGYLTKYHVPFDSKLAKCDLLFRSNDQMPARAMRIIMTASTDGIFGPQNPDGTYDDIDMSHVSNSVFPTYTTGGSGDPKNPSQVVSFTWDNAELQAGQCIGFFMQAVNYNSIGGGGVTLRYPHMKCYFEEQ